MYSLARFTCWELQCKKSHQNEIGKGKLDQTPLIFFPEGRRARLVRELAKESLYLTVSKCPNRSSREEIKIAGGRTTQKAQGNEQYDRVQRKTVHNQSQRLAGAA